MEQQNSAGSQKGTLKARRERFNRMSMQERGDLFVRIIKKYYQDGVTVSEMSADRRHTFGRINTGRIFDYMVKHDMIDVISLYSTGTKNRNSSLYLPHPRYEPEPLMCHSCGQEIEDEDRVRW